MTRRDANPWPTVWEADTLTTKQTRHGLNLRNFEVILVSNTLCFESKTLLIYQNATFQLGSDEHLPIENLWDKILEFLFISNVTRNYLCFVKQAPCSDMTTCFRLIKSLRWPCCLIGNIVFWRTSSSRWARCINRASRPSQGTLNGYAVSKWPRCRWDVKHNQQIVHPPLPPSIHPATLPSICPSVYPSLPPPPICHIVFLYFMMLVNKTIWLDIILLKTPMVLIRAGMSRPARRCQRLAEERAREWFVHAYNTLDLPMRGRSPYMG